MLKVLSFDLVTNRNTDEPQWQARREEPDWRTTVYVVSNTGNGDGRWPSYDQPRWICEVGKTIFASANKEFRIVLVRLIEPKPEEMNLLFVLGQHNRKPQWQARAPLGPVEVTFVLDHKRKNELEPNPRQPYWRCKIGNFVVGQDSASRRVILPVTLEEPLEVETWNLTFTKGEDPAGRPQFQCKKKNGLGIRMLLVVDRVHHLRVKESNELRWFCLPGKVLRDSRDGLFRIQTVIPVAPAPVSPRRQRRRKNAEERRARTAA